MTWSFSRSASSAVCRISALEHDERLWLDQLALVSVTDDSRLQYRVMCDQSRLDLGWRNIEATDLEHVVGAARIDIVPVFVTTVLVAALSPRPVERVPAALPVIPVILGACRPGNLQLADLALFCRASFIIDEPNLIPGNGLAGGAVAHVAGPIRQKDMQHLGRSYPVEDIDAETLGPASSDIERQRFAGRGAYA